MNPYLEVVGLYEISKCSYETVQQSAWYKLVNFGHLFLGHLVYRSAIKRK